MLRLYAWLDERYQMGELARHFFLRSLPRGVGWSHTLGSALLFLIGLQVVTGIFLAVYYVASPAEAYESIQHITSEIPFGFLIRGVHKWGASAIVVVAVLHLLRVFFMAGYKYPRELSWVVGIFLLVLVFMEGFTGYLLPMDQKAYWATVVGTHLAEKTPLIGPALLRVTQAGLEPGPLTLSRFYAFHTMFFGGLLGVLAMLHMAMVIKQGIAPPPQTMPSVARTDYARAYEESKRGGQPFYEHLLKDGAISLLLLLGLLALAVYLGSPLEEAANPADVNYVPRPEWYFYFLFELLWFFPGPWVIVPSLIVPVLGTAALVVLPFLDRGPARHPARRPLATLLAIAVIAAVAYLSYKGATAPAPPTVTAAPSPPPGVVGADPEVELGWTLYQELGCAACHIIAGQGGVAGPDLSRVGARRDAEWLRNFIRDPKSVNPGAAMPAFDLPEDKLSPLVRFLGALR
ncbi:MAG: cytochrome b N-terminal domain-containing protein [Chloroflexi bacterium]|nr:cytochrome b N-terminal domain-containing protein [Chloroflexota bacterium]